MVDVLTRIKKLVIARRVEFALKAEEERLRDGLTVEDVLESVVNLLMENGKAKGIRLRDGTERLYVVESPNFSGTWIYTKGTIRRKAGQEVFYVFVSSKLAQ